MLSYFPQYVRSCLCIGWRAAHAWDRQAAPVTLHSGAIQPLTGIWNSVAALRRIYAIEAQTTFKTCLFNLPFGNNRAFSTGVKQFPGSLNVSGGKKMMLQRTSTDSRPHSLSARRLRTRSFRAWSGAALSRYFHKSDRPEPQPESSREQGQSPSTHDDMDKRREQLQELLQQVDAERLNREKKTG